MTATLIPMLVFQPMQKSSTTGQMVPIPGGKLYTYAAGTTTPLAVYSDTTGTTPLANPVILDANGIAQIYLGTASYKFLLTDSAGATIYPYPIDNVYPDQAVSLLRSDLASTASAGVGDALIGVKQPYTGSVATTQHLVNARTLHAADFGVVANGSTNDRPALQVALDALPATGGTLILPRGTMLLDGTPLTIYTKSNIRVIGAGMGASLLDGSAGGGEGIIICGYANGGAPSPAVLNNLELLDFSICGSSTSATNHVIVFRGINNVRFENLEVYNGYNEVVYCDGSYPSFKGLTVVGCYFHDCVGNLSSCINTNTTGVTDIKISRNRFVRVSTGMFILGQNISISDNSFTEVNTGINVGESNAHATASISSCAITGNTFIGLGKSLVGYGGYAFTGSSGIMAKGISKIYDDGDNDNGVVVSGNTFKSGYADIPVSCLELRGGVTAVGNYACGLKTNTAIASAIFINVQFSTDPPSYVGVNSVKQYVYLKQNVLELLPAGGTGYDYTIGINVVSTDKAYLYCSGNVIASSGQSFISTTSNGFLPFISLDGDIIQPYCRFSDLIGTDIAGPAAGAAIYGDNSIGFRSAMRDDLRIIKLTNAGATPSVAGGRYFGVINAAPQSVTDFLNASGATYQTVTLFFSDANTTLVHAAGVMILNGSVDFESSAGACITLAKPNIINAAWYEVSRSKP